MLVNDFARAKPPERESAPPKVRSLNPQLAFLASLMDDIVTVPGTKFKIGLDGLIGLIPGVGDLATLVIASMFLQEAHRIGVSRWTRMRMVGNYLIDLTVGAIPLVGDAFDFGFKAHRRNFRLLQEHLEKHPDTIRGPGRFRVDLPLALLAAFVAGSALTLTMFFVPAWAGMERMDIGLTIAELTAPAGGTPALLSRLAWHMGNAVLFVLVYTAVLRYGQKQSTLRTGAIFGILFWLAGPMLLVPLVLNLWTPQPEIFMLDLGGGWTPAALNLGAYLFQGILAGGIYKHRTEHDSRVTFSQG